MLKEYKGAKTTANLGKNSPVTGLKPTFNSGDAGRSFYSNRKAPAGNSTYPDKSGTSTRELLKMAVVTSAYIHKKRTAKLLNLVSWKKVTLPT